MHYTSFQHDDWGSWSGWIKRDDQIHPLISGNKWRKLRLYVNGTGNKPARQLLTIGGPHSNHLLAVAAYAKSSGILARAIIPKLYTHKTNAILSLIRKLGAELLEIDRSKFRTMIKDSRLLTNYAACEEQTLIVPFGADGPQGKKGCREIAREIEEKGIQPDSWLVPVGTACTAEGIAEGIQETTTVILHLPFRNSKIRLHLYDRLNLSVGTKHKIIWTDPPKQKFGFIEEETAQFALAFYQQTNILLDPLYNGPMMRSVCKNRRNELGESVFIHTGGMFGWLGMKERYPDSESVTALAKMASATVPAL